MIAFLEISFQCFAAIFVILYYIITQYNLRKKDETIFDQHNTIRQLTLTNKSLQIQIETYKDLYDSTFKEFAELKSKQKSE